jgi:glutamate dehydrogenase
MGRDETAMVVPTLEAVLPALSGEPVALQLAPLLLSADMRTALAGSSGDAVAADLRATAAFIAVKPAHRHALRVRPSVDGTASLIEIINDDMPFLVDSVMAEAQASQLQLTALVHPLLATERSAEGHLAALRPAGPDVRAGESLIVATAGPLSEEAARRFEAALDATLTDVRAAVTDFRAMTAEVEAVGAASPSAAVFLSWILDGHFVLLGTEKRRFDAAGIAHPVEGAALGLCRLGPVAALRRAGREVMTVRSDARAAVTVTKANAQSRVHRRTHMDHIAVATPEGEFRLVGLFTSKAYTTPARATPLLTEKIDAVLRGAGYPPGSHGFKALVSILDTFPRDELFAISVDDLAAAARGILDLELRPRVRIFARQDGYDRFVSVLVYAPRERWTTHVREQVAALLVDHTRGRIAAYQPFFLEGPLLRAQFIVALGDSPAPALDTADLEARTTEIMRTFSDRLADALAVDGPAGAATLERYAAAFPADYTEAMSAVRAVEDIRRLDQLALDPAGVAIDFYREPGASARDLAAAVARVGASIRLSERVPVLENFGFAVADERSYTVRPRLGGAVTPVALHHMRLEAADGSAVDLDRLDERLEDAFRAVFRGAAENDMFNGLVRSAGATWREAALVRALAAYLRQLGVPFGFRAIGEAVVRHAGITRDLVELFHVKFDPDHRFATMEARIAAAQPIKARIEGALAGVESLDEDRILRLLLSLIEAAVRTSFYRRDDAGKPLEAIAIKFDTGRIDAAPAPRPWREVWVHAPRVEGVHLRFGPVARGGLRWSDRAGDFRTEVLGLVRAQLVKNAVIVPSGAKGGFVPKRLPRGGTRDDIQAEGTAAYRVFVSSLLDVTDNLVDDRTMPPPRVVRHDQDDPYLVVAADKGTATFSDVANAISLSRGHWLGDAFASGGSVGYDHKKMGITARGAWECVKRHFREGDVDIQTTPFSVAGVGDMSGDVFGNGMLLSPVIKLVAAFDHRDIFLDPDPDPAVGFAERQRLFALPRSSWQDYDKRLLSPGGGVFSRAAKRIPLSAEVRHLLGVEAEAATAAEVIRAILKLPVDLLWFGGIGTYVRAAAETDEQVGDRANDAVRITAAEVGASVIGEGANLGLTQRARIELAERGVRLNTDFVDNSAGVNSSDVEVNIKIALGRATRSGALTGEARRAFLAAMTDDVAGRCLANNHEQSLAISLAEKRAGVEARDFTLLMRDLEARGLLDRKLEVLPNDMAAEAHERAGRALTRPELALLLSYAKIALREDVIASRWPDTSLAAPLLDAYMPPALRDAYAADVTAHRLRREIIATALTNAALNRMGPAAAAVLARASGRSAADVAGAYLIAARAYGIDALWRAIDARDGRMPGARQLDVYLGVQRDLRTLVHGLLVDEAALRDPERTHADITSAIAAMPGPPTDAPALRGALADGFSAEVASMFARLSGGSSALVLARTAAATGQTIDRVAVVSDRIATALRLDEARSRLAAVVTSDADEAEALSRAQADIAAVQAALTRRALALDEGAGLDSIVAPVRAALEALYGKAPLRLTRALLAARTARDAASGSP